MAIERGESSSMGARARRRTSTDSAATGPRPASPPTASFSELRDIRSHYRDLKTEISGEKDDIVRNPEKFNVLIGRVESLYNKVDRPREQIADLEAIRDLSACVVQYAKSMQQSGGPTASDFCAVVVNKCKAGGGIDWTKLGAEASAIFCDAPGVSTMIGPMDVIPRQRRRAAPRTTRERLGPATRPEEVAAVDSISAETDKNIETMFKILRTHRRVRFEALVLNRRSFAQTIENIFALSFLVKDGRVEISNHDGINHIVPKNAPSGNDRSTGRVVNTQFVLRLDYQDWEFMKQSLEEQQELMPDRAAAPAPAAAAASGSSGASGSAAAAPTAVTPIRKTSRNRARETAIGSQAADGAEEEEDEAEGSRARRPKKARRRLESS